MCYRGCKWEMISGDNSGACTWPYWNKVSGAGPVWPPCPTKEGELVPIEGDDPEEVIGVEQEY